VTAPPRTDRDDGRLEVLRWVLCGAVVVAAHGLALMSLRPNLENLDNEAGSPVAFIELAPMAVAPPAPESDLATGPVQPDSEYRAAEKDAPPPPMEQPQETGKASPPDPPPPLPPVAELPRPEVEQPPATKEAAIPNPDPAPPPPPVEAAQQPPSELSVPSAPPTAASRADHAAGPAMDRMAEQIAPRAARWEQSLVAHIERFKRYPRQAEGRFGVARLAFTIDRHGRLLGARVVAGSGSAILDDEALATIRRAEPFPVPPDGLAEGQLSFVLPIRYAPPGQRERPRP
jgi:periplasmic protein TonB